MKKFSSFHLKSLMMLFLLSLFGASAWALQPAQNLPEDMFYFQALEDGTVIQITGGNAEVKLVYSTDGSTWSQEQVLGTSNPTITFPALNTNQKIYIKASSSQDQISTQAVINKFAFNSGSAKVGGNIMYLLNGTNPGTSFATGKTYIFRDLFAGCTGLKDASDLTLPATELVEGCYQSMFSGCTNLVSGPKKIDATTLAESCCLWMFKGCTNLVNAPELPAETLVTSCYYYMFSGCSNLNKIVVGFSAWGSNNETDSWLNNVASTGTFISTNPSLDLTQTGNSKVPTGWIKQLELPGVCFQAVGEASTIKMEPNESFTVNGAPTVKLEYYRVCASGSSYTSSTDWADFYSKTYGQADATGVTVDLSSGDKVYIRAKGTGQTANPQIGMANDYNGFVMTGNIKASGNIMYLLDKNATATTGFNSQTWVFKGLFKGCSALKNVVDLKLPATAMTEGCYNSMFNNTGIASAPELPARQLAAKCYRAMFFGCSSLQTAPELPATQMQQLCYADMFQNCTQLQTAPELPATQLAQWCYDCMFMHCWSLTTAPTLPATTLVSGCYKDMFYYCSNLTNAPVLPAATLVSECYQRMFEGCSKINQVTAAFTDWAPNGVTNATTDWLKNVKNDALDPGTFTALSSQLDMTVARGGSSIPTNWNATAAQFDWTLTPGATTYDGTSLKINVTAAVKVDGEAWANSLTTNDDKKTVSFYTKNIDPIGAAGAGTLSAGTNAGEYVITVTDAATITALKAKLGQQIQFQLKEGALRASQVAETAPYFDMDESKAVAFTLPAAVNFTLTPSDIEIDQEQALNGFDLYVQTTGGVKPTVVAGKKISIKDPSNTLFVVELANEPTKVSGTNKWKFTAKVKRNSSDNIMIWNGDNQTDTCITEVPANTYPLNIEAGAFSAGLSSSTAMTGSVDVQAKAEITISSYGVIKDAAVDPATGEPITNYSFYVKVEATGNGYSYDPTTLAQGWTISDYTGTILVENDNNADPIYGDLKVTLQYDKFVNNKTSWILTIPEGKFRSNNNVNKLTKINFTIQDRAVWTKATKADQAVEGDYVISIDEVDGVATIVPTTNDPAQVISILDESKIKLVYYKNGEAKDVSATYSLAQANEELKVAADFSVANTPYYVIFDKGAVKAGNTVFPGNTATGANTTEVIVARIDVTAGYTFVDASITGETATTKDDLEVGKTYNSFTYKRNYTGKLETLFVPFNIVPDAVNEILDNVKIWRLVNINLDENKQPVFNFVSVANDETVYANMPYLIKANAAGEYAMTQKDVTVEEPTSNSIESSSSFVKYTFTGVVEPTPAAGKWVLTKSQGKLALVPETDNGSLGAWRWYMTTTAKNINYINIRLDGDYDNYETSIDEIETAGDEEAVIFNLNGQRMNKVQRGAINVINGKKVFIKK